MQPTMVIFLKQIIRLFFFFVSVYSLSYKYVKIIVLKDEVIKHSQDNDLSLEVTRVDSRCH